MKRIYSLIVCSFFALTSFAGTIKATTNSDWSNASAWSSKQKPVVGDVVEIPAGITVTISHDEMYLNGSLSITVKGTLKFVGNNSTLQLESGIISIMGGTIEGDSPSQKIKFGGKFIYNGAEVISGYFMANSNQGFAPTSQSQIVLPVKFIGFSVARTNNGILVQWSTSEEHNAKAFEVERSVDGSNWNTIATLTAAGNASSLNNYSYTDRNNNSKTSYYRVKQTDIDSKAVYTAVRSISADAFTADVKVASIPNKVVLQFPQQIKNGVSVRIVSLSGQVISEKRIEQAVGQVILNTSAKGNYIVSVSNGQDVNVARQVIL